MSNYMRVFPRDLFNEAKLLKCLGRLSLLIADEVIKGTVRVSCYGPASQGFDIQLGDHVLSVDNLIIYINGKECRFRTPYNSKDDWPLMLVTETDTIRVFTEGAELSGDFLEEIARYGN